MNKDLIPYEELVLWLGLDPKHDDTKPHVVRKLLDKSGVRYVFGKGNRPCVTIQALSNANHNHQESDDSAAQVVNI